jgi:hypothetical protein
MGRIAALRLCRRLSAVREALRHCVDEPASLFGEESGELLGRDLFGAIAFDPTTPPDDKDRLMLSQFIRTHSTGISVRRRAILEGDLAAEVATAHLVRGDVEMALHSVRTAYARVLLEFSKSGSAGDDRAWMRLRLLPRLFDIEQVGMALYAA